MRSNNDKRKINGIYVCEWVELNWIRWTDTSPKKSSFSIWISNITAPLTLVHLTHMSMRTAETRIGVVRYSTIVAVCVCVPLNVYECLCRQWEWPSFEYTKWCKRERFYIFFVYHNSFDCCYILFRTHKNRQNILGYLSLLLRLARPGAYAMH